MTELLSLTFIRPWWLLALLPAGVLLVQLYRHGWRRSAWEQWLPRPLQGWLLHRHPSGGHKLRFLALGSTWLLLIVALAGPALETSAETRRVDDNALVIVLDLSRNMMSNDLTPDRLERARFKIRTLIHDYADSQLSLIVYAGSAHRVTPLSTDHATLTNLLNALDPSIMPVDGQAVGPALTLARQAIEQRPRRSSHILLLTSGLDDEGQQQLAEQAAELGSQLSIMGVGTRSGAPVPLAEGGFLRDAQGRILLPRLNSQQLSSLARQHGVRYHDISIGNRDLDYLLQPLQAGSVSVASERRLLTDQGHWLVLLLLPIAALGARRGWLGLLLCAALLPTDAQAFNWADLWQRADQQAMQLLENDQPAEAADRFSDPNWRSWALYQAGNYPQAAAAWAELAQAQPDQPEHHFNRGTALAMAGDYQAALEAYEHTLTMAPDHHAARQNRKLIEDYLEQLREQAQQDETEQARNDQGDASQGANRAAAPSSATPPNETDSPNAQEPGMDPATTGNITGAAAADGSGSSAAQQSAIGAAPATDADSNDGNSQTAASQQRNEQERQQALNQWLLDIPDDPAELLRRKFLYQHLQQQDATP
ncbi:MAG: VWA domain-containing protein [Pseudomonas sp.]